VCPLCLVAGSEKALEGGWLSREDVPPKRVGGRKIVLTCRQRCNNRAGHEIDSHARREADLYDFMDGRLSERTGKLKTDSGQVPIRFSVADHGIKMFGVPRATHPTAKDTVFADFNRAALPDGWKDFTFKVVFEGFSPSRAATSWLRSAYLAFFAAFGYRFVYRPELDVVRERIKNPESKEPMTFRIIRPEPAPEPTLIRIDRPEPFRGYAMLYGRNVVFLPRYGDHELYARLATHPECNVSLAGIMYPWPTRPMFLHDRQVQEPNGSTDAASQELERPDAEPRRGPQRTSR